MANLIMMVTKVVLVVAVAVVVATAVAALPRQQYSNNGTPTVLGVHRLPLPLLTEVTTNGGEFNTTEEVNVEGYYIKNETLTVILPVPEVKGKDGRSAGMEDIWTYVILGIILACGVLILGVVITRRPNSIGAILIRYILNIPPSSPSLH